MSWNYRVQRVEPAPLTLEVDGCTCQPDAYYGIIEVFYNDQGEPDGYAEIDQTKPYGDTPEELRADLELMLQAFDRPIVEITKDHKVREVDGAQA